jgi:hypothetical protein
VTDGLALGWLAAVDGHPERVDDQLTGELVLIDRPTTRRLNASTTTASYSQPSQVRR